MVYLKYFGVFFWLMYTIDFCILYIQFWYMDFSCIFASTLMNSKNLTVDSFGILHMQPHDL